MVVFVLRLQLIFCFLLCVVISNCICNCVYVCKYITCTDMYVIICVCTCDTVLALLFSELIASTVVVVCCMYMYTRSIAEERLC